MLKFMQTGFLIIATMLAATACTTTGHGAAVGAATGTVIGGVATGRSGGAVVGAAIGAVTGALIGKSKRRGYCRYRDRRGRIYEARCR